MGGYRRVLGSELLSPPVSLPGGGVGTHHPGTVSSDLRNDPMVQVCNDSWTVLLDPRPDPTPGVPRRSRPLVTLSMNPSHPATPASRDGEGRGPRTERGGGVRISCLFTLLCGVGGSRSGEVRGKDPKKPPDWVRHWGLPSRSALGPHPALPLVIPFLTFPFPSLPSLPDKIDNDIYFYKQVESKGVLSTD